MAYSASTLIRLNARTKSTIGSVWLYRTADAVGTVVADGYFDDAAGAPIASHDLILVVSTNATPFTQLYRATTSGGPPVDDVAIAIALPDLTA